ncbi:MAG: hypothetical protein ACLP9L_23815 [Thermoguttaceae bacterium]
MPGGAQVLLAGAALLGMVRGIVVGIGDKYGVVLGAHGLHDGAQAGAHPQAGWQ